MNLIGLEICDAGILAAGGEPPRLLHVDQGSLESPGFALPDKKTLITGIAAERQARLFPRRVLNRFWGELSTDPLDPPLPSAGNQAEVACAHLAHVWEQVRGVGDGLLIAVPASFERSQMGLLLGMAQEIGIPVEGFVSLPVAAAAPGPERLHLHVDAHLHCFEVAVLTAGDRLELQEVVAVNTSGREGLYNLWAQATAAEFVRATRFDPFHSAQTEQELYRRLPALLTALHQEQAASMSILAGRATYSVSVMRGVVLETARPIYDELMAAVHDAARRSAAPGATLCLHVAHRAARLPGVVERLRRTPTCRVVELPAGAAALALSALWPTLTRTPRAGGAAFHDSRPWTPGAASGARTPAAPARRPTHLLYRHLAYPLTADPLTAGSGVPAGTRAIRIAADAPGIDPAHCAVQLKGETAVLTDHSSAGTFLNETRVEGVTALAVGDVIRLGASAETLLAIACLSRDEA
ncbi:MAG: FHA domain-containing protein [Desulfobacterales bacterium]|nr:FHA domain-containing protein [Desulfobacterales bacterium]